MLVQFVVKIVLALIAAAGVVGATLLPRLLPSVRSHGDRALALQEVELLTMLDPGSEAAKHLNAIIEHRIEGWHTKMFPPSKEDRFGQALAETFKPYDGPVPRWVRVVQVALVTIFGGLFVALILSLIVNGAPPMRTCGILLPMPC